MILDNEDQRTTILQCMMSIKITADYAGLCESFPRLQATVQAVKSATILQQESSDAGSERR